MKRPVLKSSIIGAFLLAGGACSSGDGGIDVATSWLGPLHQYEQIRGTEDFGVYVMKDGGRPAYVERVLVGPAEITISAESDLNAISPATYEKLRNAFTTALAREVARRLPASSQATGAKDIYILRTALTNLTVKRKAKKFGQVGLDGLEFTFDRAAVELGLHERRSNARRGVVIEKASGKPAQWSALPDRFQAFAAKAIEKAAEARTAINKKASKPEPAAPAPKNPPPPAKK